MNVFNHLEELSGFHAAFVRCRNLTRSILRHAAICFFGLAAESGFAQPTVSNVTASQKPGTTQVEIRYDLSHALGQNSNVTVEMSKDGGATYVSAGGATGALGVGIPPGVGKAILWEASGTWPNQLLTNVRAQITASDEPAAPAGMVLIPAGTFTMGNSLSASGDGDFDELPTHLVTLPAFYLARTETTWAEFVAVRTWAVANGYANMVVPTPFEQAEAADTRPVHSVSWIDAVIWCNAKSEKEGLVPVYYADDAQTTVYRRITVVVTDAQVKWSANGYRLPTEAEWEYAARGGLAGKRFPWGDTITHSQANYFSLASNSFDVSPTRGYHPTYDVGQVYYTAYTNPVTVFSVNGYGLYGMAGNLAEWCWDWYGSYSSAAVTAPLGPVLGFRKVVRGGAWNTSSGGLRCAFRHESHPGTRFNAYGFRPARNFAP